MSRRPSTQNIVMAAKGDEKDEWVVVDSTVKEELALKESPLKKWDFILRRSLTNDVQVKTSIRKQAENHEDSVFVL